MFVLCFFPIDKLAAVIKELCTPITGPWERALIRYYPPRHWDKYFEIPYLHRGVTRDGVLIGRRIHRALTLITTHNCDSLTLSSTLRTSR